MKWVLFYSFRKTVWENIYSAYSKLPTGMEASSLFIAIDMVRQMIATHLGEFLDFILFQ